MDSRYIRATKSPFRRLFPPSRRCNRFRKLGWIRSTLQQNGLLGIDTDSCNLKRILSRCVVCQCNCKHCEYGKHFRNFFHQFAFVGIFFFRAICPDSNLLQGLGKREARPACHLVQGITTKRCPSKVSTPGRAIARASRQTTSEKFIFGRDFWTRNSSPRKRKDSTPEQIYTLWLFERTVPVFEPIASKCKRYLEIFRSWNSGTSFLSAVT